MTVYEKLKHIIRSEKVNINYRRDDDTISIVEPFFNVDTAYHIIMTYDMPYNTSYDTLLNTMFVGIDNIYKVTPADLSYEFIDEISNLLSIGEEPFVYVVTPKKGVDANDNAKLNEKIQKLKLDSICCSRGVHERVNHYYLLTTYKKRLSEINKLKLYGIDVRKLHIEVGYIRSDDFIKAVDNAINLREYLVSYLDIIETHNEYIERLYGDSENSGR